MLGLPSDRKRLRWPALLLLAQQLALVMLTVFKFHLTGQASNMKSLGEKFKKPLGTLQSPLFWAPFKLLSKGFWKFHGASWSCLSRGFRKFLEFPHKTPWDPWAWCFEQPLSEGLHKASCLGASQSPLKPLRRVLYGVLLSNQPTP